MRVLVTGGDGQLGRSLHKVWGEYPEHDFVFTDIAQADITDSDQFEQLIEEAKPDVIFNCAAYTAVDKAEIEYEAAYRINEKGPEILAELVCKYGIKLVHISTDYVFDGCASTPISEDTRTNPMNVYGRSKLAGEQAIMYSGCNSIIIRTSWLYSEFGNNFVKTMIRLGDEKDQISVVNDQFGSPTYAPDLARAIISISEKQISGCNIYHFCNKGVISWYDFAIEIFRQKNMATIVNPISTNQYHTPANRPRYSVLDTSKIESQGVSTRDWRDALAECIKCI